MNVEPIARGDAWERLSEGTFVFRDPAYGIVIRLRGLRVKDGHAKAKVEVFKVNEDGHERRVTVRPVVNLTSNRSTDGIGALKNHLTEIWKSAGWDEYDWLRLFERINYVLNDELEHRGTVSELERIAVELVAQPMAFRHFMPRDRVSLLVAHGGTGKSMQALLMAVAVATGMPVGGYTPEIKGPVLYLDWEEEDDRTHRARLTRLAHGLEIDVPHGIFHFLARGPLLDIEDEILELCQKLEPVFIIADSLGSALPNSNLNDAAVATQATAILKRFPGTKLAIAHPSKQTVRDGGGGNLGAIGSVFFWNGVRASYTLKAGHRDMHGNVLYTIKLEKGNLVPQDSQPLGTTLRWVDPDGQIVPEKATIVIGGEGEELLSSHERLAQALAKLGRASMEEIARLLKLSKQDVDREFRPQLRQMVNGGYAHSWVIDGKEVFALAVREEPKAAPVSVAEPEPDPSEVIGECIACARCAHAKAEHDAGEACASYEACTKPATMYSPFGEEVCHVHFG